jgi:hypothetical protein
MRLAMPSMVGGDYYDAFVAYAGGLNGLYNLRQRRIYLAEGFDLLRRTLAIFVASVIRIGEMNETEVRLVLPNEMRSSLGHNP